MGARQAGSLFRQPLSVQRQESARERRRQRHDKRDPRVTAALHLSNSRSVFRKARTLQSRLGGAEFREGPARQCILSPAARPASLRLDVSAEAWISRRSARARPGTARGRKRDGEIRASLGADAAGAGREEQLAVRVVIIGSDNQW